MSQDGPKQTEYSMELKLAAVRRPGAPPLSRRLFGETSGDFELRDLAGASNTLGGPSFAHFAKGGGREYMRNVVSLCFRSWKRNLNLAPSSVGG